jgi:hypothetical protein
VDLHDAPIASELERRRLLHRETRLRLVVRTLEQRVADKRRRGHLVPLALRRSLDDFNAELERVRGRLV